MTWRNYYAPSLNHVLSPIKTEEIEGRMKSDKLNVMKMKSIADVLEEVDVLINTHFFNEFSGTKSSLFLKK